MESTFEANDNPDDLQKQLQRLKQHETELMEKNRELEQEFGVKRAQFMKLYLTKEEELKASKKEVEQLQSEVFLLNDHSKKIEDELNGVRTAAALSEQDKQDAIESLKRRYESQLESFKEYANSKNESSTEFEEERARLTLIIERLELEVNELRNNARKQSTSPASITDFANKVIRRKNNIVTAKGRTPASNETLEDSMEKAQETADMLRSVVVPMEEEIASLRSKLRETQTKLKYYENKQSKHQIANQNLIDIQGDLEGANEEVKGLQSCLSAERSSRTDLEMYVAVLNTQKDVLQEEKQRLEEEFRRVKDTVQQANKALTFLVTVCRLLEDEKMAGNELKQTWKLANDGFLERQKSFQNEIDCMKILLSPQQQEILQDMLYKKDNKESHPSNYQVSSSINFASQSADTGIILPNLPIQKSENNNKLPPVTEQNNRNSTDDTLIDLSSTDTSNRLGPASSLTSLNVSSNYDERIKRVQSDNNVASRDKSKSFSVSSPYRGDSGYSQWTNENQMPNKDSFFRNELASLQQEVKQLKEKLSSAEALCDNYELQLQNSEKDIATHSETQESLKSQIEIEKNVGKIERQRRLALEKSMKTANDKNDVLIKQYREEQDRNERLFSSIEESYKIAQKQIAEQIKDLSDSRNKLTAELSMLKAQYSALQNQQQAVSSGSASLSALSQAQSNYREEINQLKQQLTVERSNSKAVETKLKREIDYLTKELTSSLLDGNRNISPKIASQGAIVVKMLVTCVSEFDPFAAVFPNSFSNSSVAEKKQEGDSHADVEGFLYSKPQFETGEEKSENELLDLRQHLLGNP
ncbi:Rab GTPase-binding effector protein 1 [Trichoplax sp. H2]|nr:Rab GTPase-binding effector protein 1 [Trichoplax sp. H2]|eukprot:RDD41113.1 Rab GTPase-binding effector protein 1 [Trichoplax sp. H2]